MITEDYVSFETAKLLKEKGFDGPCYAYWHEDENEIIVSHSMYPIQNITNPCFFGPAAPTLQMAQKWFREEKHLAINPSTFYRKLEGHEFHNWGCNIVNLDTWELYCSNPLETFPADTYEEALEKAMKYALEKFV